jgi:hypothetical protein
MITRCLSRLGRELRAVGARRSTEVSVAAVSDAIRRLERIDPVVDPIPSDNERPIFVLATGWRTGSTLMQRVLATDRRLLVWGEPWGRLAMVPRITEAMCSVTATWPPPQYVAPRRLSGSTLATAWTANLSPDASSIRAAYRQALDAWLGQPARRRGFTRWGCKEVRLTAADAVGLAWLYPQAKFVLIARHPWHAYQSIAAGATSWRVYTQASDRPIDTAIAFARHWNRIATSWGNLPADFPARLVRYEDVVAGTVDWARLADWLEVAIDPRAALSVRVGASCQRRSTSITARAIVQRCAANGMQLLGYARSSAGTNVVNSACAPFAAITR